MNTVVMAAVMVEIHCLPHSLPPQHVQPPYFLAKTLAFHLYLNLAIPGFPKVIVTLSSGNCSYLSPFAVIDYFEAEF